MKVLFLVATIKVLFAVATKKKLLCLKLEKKNFPLRTLLFAAVLSGRSKNNRLNCRNLQPVVFSFIRA